MPTIGDFDRGGYSSAADELITPSPRQASYPGRFLWPILCLFQMGLLAGGFLVFQRHIATTTTPGPKDPVVNQDVPPEGNIDRGDEFLREARYDRALAIYQRLSAGAAAPLRDLLRYRSALCQEALGLHGGPGQALENYQAAARDPRIADAAELGQARVAVRMGKPEEATRLLYGLLLRSEQLAEGDETPVAEIRYWLALALTRQALPVQKTAALDEVVGHAPSDWSVERALDWVSLVQEPGPKELEALLVIAGIWPRPGLPVNLALSALAVDERIDLLQQQPKADLVEVLQRPDVSPEEYFVNVWQRGNVSELLERLVAKAGLKSKWTPAAQRLLEGRVATVAVDQLPLRDALTALAEPRGVRWQIDQDQVHFSGAEETPRQVTDRIAAARRALLSALSWSGHPLTAAAYLELGNLAAYEGKLMEAEGKLQEAETKRKDALALYERLLREESSSQSVAEASYNRGLMLRHLTKVPKHLSTARAAFYHVVDQMPGHELVPWAYWQIGRTHLEEGEPQQALAPLQRAVSASTQPGLRPAAVIALAGGHLLVGNPRAAHSLLAGNVESVRQEPYLATAAFLEALARFRAADPKQAARERRNLLATLKAVPEDNVLGPISKLLVLQAYAQMGMSEDMSAYYDRCLRLKGEARPRGAIAAEMCYALAESLYAAEKWSAAKKQFASLVAMREGKWVALARFRLAAIALQESQLSDADKLYPIDYCLETCHKLLREQAAIDQRVLLKLMGQAYMARGDELRKKNRQAEAEASYRRAAACFDGKPPDDAGS